MKLYLVALVPDKKLKDEIQRIKEDFAEKYNARHALKLPPHITILPPFKLSEKKETYLISRLEGLCSKEEPFTLRLNGYGSFPPRVIFIDIENKMPVTALFKKVSEHLKDPVEEIFDKGRDIHPHITIATRDLKREAFKKAWQVYKEKDFKAEFLVQQLVLFRHNGIHWEQIQGDFDFFEDENKTEFRIT